MLQSPSENKNPYDFHGDQNSDQRQWEFEERDQPLFTHRISKRHQYWQAVGCTSLATSQKVMRQTVENIEWDPVIVDEAHKVAAYACPSGSPKKHRPANPFSARDVQVG